MGSRAWAILWAQWRTLRNHLPRSSRAGVAFTAALMLIWYGGFALMAVSVASFVADPAHSEFLPVALARGLLTCFLYWQVMPLMMASLGSALDLRKLLAYPVPHRELFALEVMLRVSTGVEVLIVLTGAGIGLLLNPKIPGWASAGLVPFVCFNLFFSVAIREMLKRVLARKYFREIAAFVFVIVAALPQVLIATGSGRWVVARFSAVSSAYWPWGVTAEWLVGRLTPSAAALLLAWTAGAYFFGRRQFERGLRFDSDEHASRPATQHRAAGLLENFYRLPGRFLADPLGALVEKELRLLTRSSRFRLVFLMGFSFGLLLWVPLTFNGSTDPGSFMARNYLTVSGMYGLLLLSDVLFWNMLGFDRSAAQIYFLAPVKFSMVVIAKNLVAIAMMLIEISVIVIVCGLLRLPLGPARVAEAFLVPLSVALFLLSIGNLSSIYNARPVNPAKSFRSSAGGRTQAMLGLLFPVMLIPAALAYLARYGFNDSNLAFYGVLLFGAAIGSVVYSISLDSAISAAGARKELLLAALSRGEGPVEN